MRLIHFFEATSQIPYLYHVAFTENVPSIVKKGIMQFQTSNWVQAGSGKRYNEDAGIFAFEHPEDAFKWAFRMRYDFDNKPTSIVRFKPTDNWEQDPSDDASLQFGKGRSMRSHRNVPPDEIIDVFHLEDFGTAPDRGMSPDEWINDAATQMLKEAKQVGILYHYTSVGQAIGILHDNALIGNPSKDVEGNPSTVSFTRNQNYHNTVEFKPTGGSARLAFDGDKMSNQFKLSPVMGSVGRKGWPMGPMGRPNNETEVVAFADSIPVKPYLAAIDVNTDEMSWSSFIDNFVVQAKEDYGITVGTIKNNRNVSFVDLSGNVSTAQKNWDKMGMQGKKGMDLSSLVTEAWVPPDAARYAAGYADNSASHTLDEVDWEYDAAFPLEMFVDSKNVQLGYTNAQGWADWYHGEVRDFIDDNGYDLWGSLEHEEIEEPVVAVFTDDGWDLWDGWHRTGASIAAGRTTIPAVVGTLKPGGFDESLTEDSNGWITAYHGGAESEGDFELGHQGKGENNLILGPGIYFADNPDIARRYTKYAGDPAMYSVEINMSNIYDPVHGEPKNMRGLGDKMAQALGFQSVDDMPTSPDSFKHGKWPIGNIVAHLGRDKALALFRKFGLDGVYETLPDGTREIAVYNPAAIRNKQRITEGALETIHEVATQEAIVTLTQELRQDNSESVRAMFNLHTYDEPFPDDDKLSPDDDKLFVNWVDEYAGARVQNAAYEVLSSVDWHGNDRVYIYRVITEEKDWPENMTKRGLGEYWSWMKSSAEAHWSQGGSVEYVITGSVNALDIDWAHTIFQNAHPDYEEEREIFIPEGTEIMVLDVEDGNQSIDPSRYPQGQMLQASRGRK